MASGVASLSSRRIPRRFGAAEGGASRLGELAVEEALNGEALDGDALSEDELDEEEEAEFQSIFARGDALYEDGGIGERSRVPACKAVD